MNVMEFFRRAFRRGRGTGRQADPTAGSNPQKGWNPVLFANGSRVRIAERAVLEEFLRTWQYHHKLQPEQLACGGRIAEVTRCGIYHGGDVIYQLKDVPGIWHECCLSWPEASQSSRNAPIPEAPSHEIPSCRCRL